MFRSENVVSPPQWLVGCVYFVFSNLIPTQNNMELPTLKLDSENLKNKVINVLSPLYIDDNTCAKLVAVFEDEIEKGDFYF